MLPVCIGVEYDSRDRGLTAASPGEVERMIQPIRFGVAVLLTALLGLTGGCIGFGVPGPIDGTPPPDGNGPDPGGNGANLAVTLRVSNPNPQPNEEVILTCALVNDSGANVTFDFQPQDGRLSVDHDAGTARFIVDESDVDVAITFTCTASDENGPGNRSNSLTIIVSPLSGDEFP